MNSNIHISKIEFSMIDCGCILCEARGRYLPFDIIEMAIEHGYHDDYIQAIMDIFEDDDSGDACIRYNGNDYDNAREYITDKCDYLYDEVDRVIQWMNDNATLPPGCIFEINAYGGDFGLYYYGVTFDYIKSENLFSPEHLEVLEIMLDNANVLYEGGLDEYTEDSICIVDDNEYPTVDDILEKVFEFIEGGKVKPVRYELGNVVE